jgi:uncharacterized YccA/Bax inhibitor family protein
MATANPAMNEAVYRGAGRAVTVETAMTIQGTVVKTGILLAILLATGVYAWQQTVAVSLEANPQIPVGLLIGGLIGGLVMALITIFSPRSSPITAPIYAACEGLVLGTISAIFNARYPGIVAQAVSASLAVLALMLFIYGTGIIRVTQKFMIGIAAATGAICLVYLVDIGLSFFGSHVPFIYQSGPIGIAFSVVVVIIAALNLILDFDFIEKGVQQRAPKYLEWYGGFSLMVTLVWMYLEILRLLAKLKDR